MKVGLMNFQIQDLLKEDFRGTLQKIADIGYDGIEYMYSFLCGEDFNSFKKGFEETGLEIIGSHAQMHHLEGELKKVIEENKKLGSRYITCAYNSFPTLDKIEQTALFYNQVGKVCKENDIQFCYHNHFIEFLQIDGHYCLDLMYQQTDPEILQTQIDVYMLLYLGIDPVKYVKKYQKRIPLLHIKDMNPQDKTVVSLGTGELDIPSIVNIARNGNTEWLIVELDNKILKDDPFAVMAESYNNLKKYF